MALEQEQRLTDNEGRLELTVIPSPIPQTIEEYYATNKCTAFHYGRCRFFEDNPEIKYAPPYAYTDMSNKDNTLMICGAAIGKYPQHLGELQRENCRRAFKSIDSDFKEDI